MRRCYDRLPVVVGVSISNQDSHYTLLVTSREMMLLCILAIVIVLHSIISSFSLYVKHSRRTVQMSTQHDTDMVMGSVSDTTISVQTKQSFSDRGDVPSKEEEEEVGLQITSARQQK